ncbi:MAG: SDR family oxidoreductase [Albidovulum sp.]|nr:SDR family oxidoreductase [Albidovulum sp.]MDE0307336.1 SDR family oxidoreductase [Albidovulum sp.]MDE0531691.1 SDR family oxidoreductase [Albidovulum sp.]
MYDKPVALIVAGGSGIGADAARKLVDCGYGVAVMSSSGKGEKLGIDLGGIGFTGSNLDSVDLKGFADFAYNHYGRIDGLVNCAGHGPKGEILEISDDDWHAGMDYYLLNVVRMARIVTPLMAKRGGSIVNVSTFAVFEPDSDFPTSAVFRAGLAAFTKLYSDNHAADGIRMNNVLPGFIDSLPEKPDRKARIPMGRYARVSELSEVISFLISDASSYITGQNIRVDGGLTRSV